MHTKCLQILVFT